jgi:hypothetical protein
MNHDSSPEKPSTLPECSMSKFPIGELAPNAMSKLRDWSRGLQTKYRPSSGRARIPGLTRQQLARTAARQRGPLFQHERRTHALPTAGG